MPIFLGSVVLGVYLLAIKWILNRGLGEIGLRLHPGWWFNLLLGFSLAALGMLIVFLIEMKMGWLTIDQWIWQSIPLGAWLLVLLKTLLLYVYVALGEETLFRGYLLTGLKEAWGDKISLGVMSVLFAAIHLFHNKAGVLKWPLLIVLLMPFGLLLGYAYIETGSLWMPIGIHTAWNLIEFGLLNLMGWSNPNLIGALTQVEGPGWLTGTFDVSTGLLGLIPITITLTVIIYVGRSKT